MLGWKLVVVKRQRIEDIAQSELSVCTHVCMHTAAFG